MDKIFYSAALINLALILAGCWPHEVIKEAPGAGADIISNVPSLIANPASPIAWWEVGGALAVIFAAGFGGPAAVRKVKKFLGKDK